MILELGAAERVEAAFDAAQFKTRAPLVCVLAGASASWDAEFLLGAGILALLTPLPLLLFTNLSAHRIYVAQLLVAILAAVLTSLPPARRWLIPKRVARSAGHRAALAQFALRGIDRSRCGALIYVSLAEHYIRIVPAEDAARAISHEQWQIAVDEALGPLAAGATEAALTGLAEDCGAILSWAIPAGRARGSEATTIPHRLSAKAKPRKEGDFVSVRDRHQDVRWRRSRLRLLPFSTRKGLVRDLAGNQSCRFAYAQWRDARCWAWPSRWRSALLPRKRRLTSLSTRTATRC